MLCLRGRPLHTYITLCVTVNVGGRHMHWGIDNDPPQVLLRPGQLGIYGAAAEAAPPGDPLPSIYVILGDSFRPFHECQANALITRHPEEA